jgi:hypothetical protein
MAPNLYGIKSRYKQNVFPGLVRVYKVYLKVVLFINF